jgi:serine/threonine protein kinase/Tol biopolymer transport system component
MALSAGTRLGPYEILAPIGAGGMGEVYRARDIKLDRDVAIKVLPAAFAQHPDRLARFEREAKVLAALNHPNIAIIYGFEDQAIVMELIAGPTLADRLKGGPLPLDEALTIARQITEALEAAHEKGIIHRDLKPANIKAPADGPVKVLDFGLATAVQGPDRDSADPDTSPTLTMGATAVGVILGTAAYMSPEQASGKPVDRRTDIWAFGVVLWEMVTGKRLFAGETISHTLAEVLKMEPDGERVPATVRRLLRRCLEKDPKKRLRSIGDVWELLEEEPRPRGLRHSKLPWAVAGALALALIVLGVLLWQNTRPENRPMMRFTEDLGPVRYVGLSAVISPDGTRLVFVGRSIRGSQLATRLLDQPRSTVIAGSEGGLDPFFSPDGQWIGFFADRKMKKISVQGGAPVTLCDTQTFLDNSGAWDRDGNIIATLDNRRLFRVPAAGGKPEMLGTLEQPSDRAWKWPQILPGGEAILFTESAATGGFADANIEVFSLKTGQVKIVQRGGYFGRYLPSGHLIYVLQGTLFGVPFNAAREETSGVPTSFFDDVAWNPAGPLDFSQTGTLVYLSGKAAERGFLSAWMDSTGKAQRLAIPLVVGLTPRISPDGKRLALSTARDLYVYDTQRDTLTKLTLNGAHNYYPSWTRDGKHIIFGSDLTPEGGESGIWWIRADGSGQPEKLLGAKNQLIPSSISPDGRRVAFVETGADTGLDLWTLPLDVSDPEHPNPGKPEPFLREPADQMDPAFSPDGRWMAYASNESGTDVVFVRPFPAGPSAGKWHVSNGAGRFPLWSRSSRELFYLGSDSRIMVAGYTVKGDSFIPEKPRQWSTTPLLRPNDPTLWNLDLAPDGKRFIVTVGPELGDDKATAHLTVLLNFFDELRRRMPAGR